MSDSLFFDYYPLSVIIIGTILNLLTLITLCQTPFRDSKKYATVHYMRAIAVFDILMLYGWNLDHYLLGIYGYTLRTYTIATCKYLPFVNFSAYGISAWLRIFICFDRYFSITRPLTYRTNRTPKRVSLMIACAWAISCLIWTPVRKKITIKIFLMFLFFIVDLGLAII